MRRKIELLRSRDDEQFYFVVKAPNGKIVATSELYRTRAGMLRGLVALHMAMVADPLSYNTINVLVDRTKERA